MPSIDSMINNVKAHADEQRNKETEGESLQDTITRLDLELASHKDIRKKINSLKEEKDKNVLEYIRNTKQPNKLDVKMINYKALFFYYKDNFMNPKGIRLSFDNYSNNNKELIQPSNMDKLKEIFDTSMEIIISVREENFPHLIGYKNSDDIKLFLRNIFYETCLINDYTEHGCDVKKIESFSWILETLKKPSFIFDSTGLTRDSKLDADLIFTKRIKNTYHYVALKKIDSYYVIISHHPLSKDSDRTKFKNNNALYVYTHKKRA